MPPFMTRSALPEAAVPAGRIGYDLDADVLLLHTIQTAAAFASLLETGELRQDPQLTEPAWPDAYDWMNRMMTERLTTTGTTAWWLWARIARSELVLLCGRAAGEVMLTCRIPRGRVLLSEFDEWHSVLNSTLDVPPRPGESEDEYDRRWNATIDDFLARRDAAGLRHVPVSRWPTELRSELESSWETIFDRSRIRSRSVWQATVHETRTEAVIDAVSIQSRV
ncbi:DUF3841 domain-containing protein [Microbacterium galbinum]|uniref:DUF3841 domain-containing protein n=1 Tax=Microbacterium galbinum TaxID=2851646 RepID=A0ABY4IVH8_9MICO|nr:DUF3841 domain-containing protein [Microbacterium galbinum]UPL15695.1 DUF3841 domain-containing protein [Microbacterium galbinum]